MSNINSTLIAPANSVPFGMATRVSPLKDTIVFLRKFGKSVGETDFASKAQYTNYKNAMRLLQDTVTMHGALCRIASNQEDISTSRDNLFTAYRKVLRFFDDAETKFELKPEKDDESALMTLAFKLVANHSEEYKVASKYKAQCKKALENYENGVEDGTVFPEGTKEEDKPRILKDSLKWATDELNRIKKLPDSTTQEPVPYSEERFRKGFENMVCDRIEKRLAMTSDEIREEKERKAKERKASKAASKAVKKVMNKTENNANK